MSVQSRPTAKHGRLRVVSLLPCATDCIRCAQEQDGDTGCELVGRSHMCEWEGATRADAKSKGGDGRAPVIITQDKIGDQSGSVIEPAEFSGSAAIGKEIANSGAFKARARACNLLVWALCCFKVDLDALKRANPDVVVTEVAAIGPRAYEDIQAALATVLGKNVTLVNWKADSLDDVWAMMKRMFHSLNSGVQGDRILESLSERLQVATNMVKGRDKARVGLVQWCHPLMSAGSWGPEIVRLAGGLPCWPSGEEIESESALVSADIQVLVFAVCGFGIDRSVEIVSSLKKRRTVRQVWQKIPAVQHGRVYILDGNKLLTRAGPLLVETAEALVEILHAEVQPFGHRGTLWQEARTVLQ